MQKQTIQNHSQPVTVTFEDLAINVNAYEHQKVASAFNKLVLDITPTVTDKEALDFQKAWLSKRQDKPTFPQFRDFTQWLYKQPGRKAEIDEEKKCKFKTCDGEGFIEVYDDKKHGFRYYGDDYYFVKYCACVIGENEHKRLLEKMYYTPHQRAIIEINKGDETKYCKRYAKEVIRDEVMV